MTTVRDAEDLRVRAVREAATLAGRRLMRWDTRETRWLRFVLWLSGRWHASRGEPFEVSCRLVGRVLGCSSSTVRDLRDRAVRGGVLRKVAPSQYGTLGSPERHADVFVADELLLRLAVDELRPQKERK